MLSSRLIMRGRYTSLLQQLEAVRPTQEASGIVTSTCFVGVAIAIALGQLMMYDFAAVRSAAPTPQAMPPVDAVASAANAVAAEKQAVSSCSF
mmetsp:Transcript_15702/g.36839  ORF Transcript_15702/g.36839 Transcript_15702/m.36839 type:complete len:93 (-) Transcript_15702:416-694(-)